MRLKIVKCEAIPTDPVDLSVAYHLIPVDPDPAYYRERVDRHIGFLFEHEQEIIKNSRIIVAGCGGIGGWLGSIFLRLGAGQIVITDPECFDVSNINRQFGAKRRTVGKNKAVETAREMRDITNDTTVMVYPQGISENTVDQVIEDGAVIADCLEFWSIGERIRLHQRARAAGISIFNAPTIGFSSRLFFFTPTSLTIEEMLGMGLEEALELEHAVRSKTATSEQKLTIMNSILGGFAPEFPEYYEGNFQAVRKRLFEDGKASIMATNPPFAAGFFADWMLMHLLRDSGIKRDIDPLPEMPGYIPIDALKGNPVVQGVWW